MRGLVLLALVTALAGCKRRDTPQAVPSAAPPASSAEPPPPPPSRCQAPTEGLVLGKDGATDDDPLPSAVQVGTATATTGGFAVGAVVPTPQGVKTAVVLVDDDAKPVKTVSLGGAYGDTQPPRIVADGAKVFGAVLEASGSLRQLRSFRVDGAELTWGATFDEKRDESLAFDVAAAGERVLLAWDEDQKDPDRGAVKLATLGKDLRPKGPPRIVTGKKTDAVSPRVTDRPGGFWLAYVALRPEKTDDEARHQGEDASFRWIEVVPLDPEGVPTGAAKRVTPEGGHVLTFDMLTTEDGGLAIVFRDDDTPTGSSGGVVMHVHVRPDGSGEPLVLSDRNLGVGAPQLLPGFLAIADAHTETRLARVGKDGRVLDQLLPEPVLGRGEPLAQKGERLLVAQFRGAQVKLYASVCDKTVTPRPAGSEPVPPSLPPE